MEYVFLIFGTLIALNFGLAKSLSEPSDATWDDESKVEIETVVEGTGAADDTYFVESKSAIAR